MSAMVTSNPSLFKLDVSILSNDLIQIIMSKLGVERKELPSLRFKRVVKGLYTLAGGNASLAIEDRFLLPVRPIPLVNKPIEFRRLRYDEITYSSDIRSSSGRRVLKKAKS